MAGERSNPIESLEPAERGNGEKQNGKAHMDFGLIVAVSGSPTVYNRSSMTDRTAHKLNFAKYLLLAAAGMGAVAAQPAERLSFEVASVKPNKSQDFRNSGIKGQPGGRLTITNIPLYRMILAAYHINAA